MMRSRESLGTSDGIAPADCDAIEQLSASVFNALDTPDEGDCRRELLECLATLNRKYGPRPSLLAVRGDFSTDDVAVRKRLYLDAYALAGRANIDARTASFSPSTILLVASRTVLRRAPPD